MNHAFTACLALLTPGRLAGYTFPEVLGSARFSLPDFPNPESFRKSPFGPTAEGSPMQRPAD